MGIASFFDFLNGCFAMMLYAVTCFTGDGFRTFFNLIPRVFRVAAMFRLLCLPFLLFGTDIGAFHPARHIGGFIQRCGLRRMEKLLTNL
ncbi:MAG: hypothetical protein VB060_13680 [Oscillibacter sp.]|nr:hypothetical protein [Oscillibacter sp.]MEA4994845.1 hypothetical protein [Oscillibacter sp.]